VSCSDPACGCCEPSAALTPMTVFNRPGLTRIGYRIGTFANFREAMIERVPRIPGLTDWTARTRDDYGIAFFELWSIVADILTFYQERTANEAFVRTAGLPDSVQRLAALLGYRPAPGLAASTRLAFTLERGRQLDIPIGVRVKSVPGPGRQPATFELIEPVVAQANLNSVSISGPPVSVTPVQAGSTGGAVAPGQAATAHAQFPGGTPALIVSESAGVVEEKRIVSLTQERDSLELRFDPPIGSNLLSTAQTVLRGFTRTFRLFGYDAPTRFLASVLDTSVTPSRYAPTWITEGQIVPGTSTTYSFRLPAGATLNLDRVVDGLQKGVEMLIVGPGTGTGFVARGTIQSVKNVAAQQGPNIATVTQITFTSNVISSSANVDLRDVTVYELEGAAVAFADQDFPATISGSRVIAPLELEDELAVKRWLFLNDATGPPEAVQVVSTSPVALTGSSYDHLAIDFTPGLSRSLDAATAVMLGNVGKATHGETVAKERLGGGDATVPFQRFTLAKPPLTYLASPGAPHGAGSTAEIRVGGLLWDEIETFFGTSPTDRVHTTRLEVDGKTSISGGDGVTGARFPTGAEISAHYRQGIGKVGMVPAGSLTTLLDRPLGLKAATNPLAAEGGADPETLASMRDNAPASVRTLGRIVSLQDFADGALESSLVAKADAEVVWTGVEESVRLTIAGPDGAHLADTARADLLADLDARRDPNRHLDLIDYTAIPLIVDVAIVAYDPKRLAEDVEAAVQSALLALFAFDNRDFGEPVHASDVLAAAQSAAGVVGIDLNRLQYLVDADRVAHGAATDAVLTHVPIGAGELATLDPANLTVSAT
jgi:hypothetical protein